MSLDRPLQSLSDDELLRGLDDLARQKGRVEADLVAHIAEVDRRRLYAHSACPSMFAYATRVLHLAEGEAFRRIRVARASRRHPILLEMLADGRLHVSGIAVLVPVLTAENRDQLLSRAVHKTKRELEQLVAELSPRPDAPSIVRKLPERPAPPPPEMVRPAAPWASELPVELFPGTVLFPPAGASGSGSASRSAPGAVRRAARALAVQVSVHSR